MTVSSSLWVCQRQQSGCSLHPVASHPSGHKNPWHGVTGATTSCPTPEGHVTGWMERSLDVEWWDSSLLAVISNLTLSPTQLNLHLPPSLSQAVHVHTHSASLLLTHSGPQIHLHSLPIQMLYQHRWIYISLTCPGAKSPLCLPPIHTHREDRGEAGHSGTRALDCAKQVNIARTGFIRIEKALLLSQVSMTDWDTLSSPHPESNSHPQLFREASWLNLSCTKRKRLTRPCSFSVLIILHLKKGQIWSLVVRFFCVCASSVIYY